ncbi:MAG: Hint domain-containing protein [Rhodospirillales bacterium]
MATKTFTNASGGTWSGANWGGVAPAAGDSLLIDIANTVTANAFASAAFDVLTINNGSAVLLMSTASSNLNFNTAAASGVSLIAGAISLTAANTLAARSFTATGGATTITSTGVINVLTTSTAGGVLTLNNSSFGIGSSGRLNIGTTTGSAAGQIGINTGGVASIQAGAALSGKTFNLGGGTVAQSGGSVALSSTATFASGAATFSGGTFQATSIAVNTGITANGGTILSTTTTGIAVASTAAVTMGGGTIDATNGGTVAGTIANAGTITGSGVLKGDINGTGTVIATGGTLSIADNVAASSNTLTVANASVLKLNGTVGANINLAGSTSTGVLEFGNASALLNFTGSIANMDIGSNNTSVAGIEFINFQGTVGSIVADTGNVFSGGTKATVFSTGGATLGTLTFASALSSKKIAFISDSTGLGGTDIFLSSVVCYAAGTAIQTDRGEAAVETLKAGDMVVTLRDGVAVPMPVKWMGTRMIEIANHPHPHTVAPIRIRAGAFGDELPRRDLLVSPAHAIYVDGKLVPANLLINHMTIVQDLHTRSVAYHHVELDRHALILAEGLTSESYLDTGNRAYFANAGLATVLHPEFHINAGLKTWEEDACAPLAIDAEIVTPIWQALADRAEVLGYVAPHFTTTNDADLYIEADGRRLRPIAVANGRHSFMLPAGVGDIVLKSRTSAPADLDPRTGDWRPLGVAVRSMTLRTGDDYIAIPADHPGLIQGWHTAEVANGTVWRWTAGNAAIPMPGTAGPAMLDIDLGPMGTYILARSDRQEQRRAA